MRAHAPPPLCVLADRAGVVEEAHVLLEALPAVIDVGHAATWKHAGEDLGANRVQAGHDVLDERRACGEREELG